MAPDKEPTNAPAPQNAETEKLVEEALAEAQASIRDIQNVAEQVTPAAGMSAATSEAHATTIDLLGDVELQVMVELGRTEMIVEDVLKLSGGSVVELDKLAGDPVDVYVNNRLVARGEVLVLNDNFCIRISEIVADLEEQATAAARQEVQTQTT
ncbi:MAG: flagellar motor switch protein FliN [Phycisphaeraceae bacterium]|nr:flagellar motor switch protein FliN [Phycisphaeraceae bacterium]